MIELNVMFFVQLGNFLITLIVLNYLLIKPVREHIRKRQENISRLLSEAEEFSRAAEKKLSDYEASLQKARAQAVAEREQLRADGVAEERRLVEVAAAEAQKSLQGARDDIAGQVASAMDDLGRRVDALARQAADKVLG